MGRLARVTEVTEGLAALADGRHASRVRNPARPAVAYERA